MGEIIRTNQGVYVRPEEGEKVSSQGDLLELVALCGEAGTDNLLLPRGSLAEDFFDLSTGLAGEIALKLSTYRVRTAILVNLLGVRSQRFKEWAWECNRGHEIHFCADEEDAVQWLLDRG